MTTPLPRPLPSLHRLFPNVYYGWIVVAGTFLQSMVCVGIGFYSQQVLVDALPAVRGFDRVEVSAASSVFFLLTGAFGFAIGPLVDRFGARGFIAVGAVVQGLALILIGRLEASTWLVPAFALLSFGFALSTSVPTSAILTRWFVAKRSLATTFSQTGVSAGGAVMIPVATWLIHGRGLELATLVLAGAIWLVTLPVVLFVLRWDPADHGLEPDGSSEAAQRSSHVSMEAQQRVWQRRQAIRTPTFWLLALAFGCALSAQVGMIAHQLAALAERLPRDTAMWGGSLIPVGSFLGRFVVGPFADRFDKRRVAMGLVGVQGLSILAFTLSTSPVALFATTLIFGMTIGNIFMLQSLITADLFGIPSFGRVYGSVQLCSQLASAAGPLLVGVLYTTYGDYPAALRWLVLLSLAGMLLLSRVRPPEPA
jgi:sugar phosphate permease